MGRVGCAQCVGFRATVKQPFDVDIGRCEARTRASLQIAAGTGVDDLVGVSG